MDAGGAGFQATNPEALQQEAYAQSGFPTHGPNGWVRYIAKDTGEPYFHNHKTGITQWDRWVAGGCCALLHASCTGALPCARAVRLKYTL